MDKYKNKFRIPSARAPFWDYGWNAAYFVTICTKNRECFFGNIVDDNEFASSKHMQFSDIGRIANKCWLEIPDHFPFVKLDEYIIMPNHVHGIIIIDKQDGERNDGSVVETQNFASLQPKNKFGPQSKNLASIIRGFKIGVTKNARLINPHFKWQPRYHDHIIRNDKSYQTIAKYIINNPRTWREDKFHNK